MGLGDMLANRARMQTHMTLQGGSSRQMRCSHGKTMTLERPMKRAIKPGLISVAMSMSAAILADPLPSMCQRLARLAKQVPAVNWVTSIQDPMDKLMEGRDLNRSGRNLSSFEKRLVNDTALRQEFSVGPEEALGIERLVGTDVYRIDAFKGTANCQYMVFIKASAGLPLRRLSLPFKAEPCVTQYGRFGNAFGQPLFVVGGQVAMGELARTYMISGWNGRRKDWTQACQLRLEFEQKLKLSGSYCSSEAPLCKAAATLAPALVEAFGKTSPLDPLAFANGLEPPDALMELVSYETNALPEFPTFAVKTGGTANPFLTTFSYSKAPARLALWIEGRWWLGVVGVAGIGWRESMTALVVISAMTDAGPAPVASFQVDKLPAGPARALWQ